MRARSYGLIAALVLVLVLVPVPALAQTPCSRAVIFTLPAATWEDVRRVRPPVLLEAAEDGAMGSVSVRTNSARTSVASGFATLGAGARVEAGEESGWPLGFEGRQGPFTTDVKVAGLDEIRMLLDESGYSTVRPGALASALGEMPLVAIGNGDPGRPLQQPETWAQWTLLAGMDVSGVVDLAATSPDLLVDDPSAPFGVRTDEHRIGLAVDAAFDVPCASMVIDHGDLTRVDRLAELRDRSLGAEHDAALREADRLLGRVRDLMSPSDLLLVVSPSSPAWDDDVHFGVGIAVGGAFAPGSVLGSPSTGREGMVTLPDVAPTVLAHLDVERPASMLGRAMFSRDDSSSDRLEAAIDLDREAVFIDSVRTPISTAFVIVQIALYALTVWLLLRGERRPKPDGTLRSKWLEVPALALAAFPVSTYLAGVVPAAPLGPLWYAALLLGLDAILVGAAYALLRTPLDRLLAIAAVTLVAFIVDLTLGAPLQLNTVFSYSPLVAGRFSGIGNIAFAVLAAAAVLTGTLIIQRWGRNRRTLAAVAVVFAVTVVVDGHPAFGSDVGGALALVPGLGLTWLLLSGRTLSWRVMLLAGLAALVAVGAFLAFDLTRPEESRTHLGRLFENVRAEGWTVLTDTIERKVGTQLRVARSTIWTFVVPPALAAIAWLLLRPQGRWERLAASFPALRAGLVGGLVLAVLGFAVNDSGIVVPAMMFAYLVPVAVLAYMTLGGYEAEADR